MTQKQKYILEIMRSVISREKVALRDIKNRPPLSMAMNYFDTKEIREDLFARDMYLMQEGFVKGLLFAITIINNPEKYDDR
jgi:hypothetical protein